MNADVFSEWLRRQGHNILRSPSSYWHSQGPRIYQAFPYHWIITPSMDELESLRRSSGIIGLRYSTPIESSLGRVSYHAVFDGQSYSMDNLGKWAKKNVRRGLRNCTVEPIPFNVLADEGWNLQTDTLARQGRNLKIARSEWETRCQSAEGLEGFEAWGARMQDGRLAASVITFIMDDCCYMLYQQCLREFLSAHVNNALSYSVSEAMMARPQVNSILYGLHSLDAPPSVDTFKWHMGYHPKAVRQRVVFHPLMTPTVSKVGRQCVKQLLRVLPGNPFLSKAEGMLGFYIDGQLSLEDQEWPECMKNSLNFEEDNV